MSDDAGGGESCLSYERSTYSTRCVSDEPPSRNDTQSVRTRVLGLVAAFGADDAPDVGMSSLSNSPMSARSGVRSGVTSDAPYAVGIGWAAMMVPFAIVLTGLLLSGRHTPSQLAMTLVLLAVPLVMLALRRRQRSSLSRGSRD